RGHQHRAARLARDGKTEPPATTVVPAAPAVAVEASNAFSERVRAAAYQTLNRALIAGLPTQIGHRSDKGDFIDPRKRRFM
ncbi:hypothetical protein, partial [Stenotrophomonas sp. SrG]|uniref:hypothetical protein n=1 Tax=Stenotrophomonas sp. SrG TaxID=3414430 RepID=UPI003CEE087D